MGDTHTYLPCVRWWQSRFFFFLIVRRALITRNHFRCGRTSVCVCVCAYMSKILRSVTHSAHARVQRTRVHTHTHTLTNSSKNCDTHSKHRNERRKLSKRRRRHRSLTRPAGLTDVLRQEISPEYLAPSEQLSNTVTTMHDAFDRHGHRFSPKFDSTNTIISNVFVFFFACVCYVACAFAQQLVA